jgi:hypothetical protein
VSDTALSQANTVISVNNGAIVGNPSLNTATANIPFDYLLEIQPNQSLTASNLTVSLTPGDAAGNLGAQVTSPSFSYLYNTAASSVPGATLAGSSGADFIYAGHAGDTIVGNGGADTIYIKSDIAVTVRLANASDSPVAGHDTIVGFNANDTLNLQSLLTGYTSSISFPTYATSNTFSFANANITTTGSGNKVATVDVIYNGNSLSTDASFGMTLQPFGTSVTVSNSLSGWTILANPTSGETQGYVLGSGTVLANGQRLFTATFDINDANTSFLFSATDVVLNGSNILSPAPVFGGTVTNGQLLSITDGATLGTLGDNEIRIAQNSDGTFIQYDTNSNGGTTTASAVIQLEGLTNPLQNLVLI